MEPAEIDWKNIDSQYERDEVYEHINAPKWLDLSAPDDASADDVAWFCRPDCRHPAIAEDFNRSTSSPKVKLVRSNSKLILSGEQKSDHRDAYLKRKGRIVTFFPSPIKPKLSYKKFSGDLENQNPNWEATLPAMKLEKKAVIAKKEAIKSSVEKKQDDADDEVRGESQTKRTHPDQPKLKSTFSAKNLFSGRDILSQISEFCHELKKFATGKESAVTEEKEKRKNIETVKEKSSLRDDYMEEKKAVQVSTK
ncbi:hypothetical protein KSP40_PGU018129 [Platanthera guangdongensis]|uniref:Uncharacterized protein n=1 Tax=Platanthera guangdongensis TaxID=2320717 RepID=A0ABR2MFF0_9ASPA